MFGKRRPAPPPPPPPSEDPKHGPGHRAVLNRLRTLDATEPEARLQLAGAVLFDLVYQSIKEDARGARIEDFLAILGSVGGHACIVGALDKLARSGSMPAGNPLVGMTGKDGNQYYFGDLPNEALLESPLSLLSLTLGAAQAHGGAVSLEKVHDVMRHVASTVGKPEFGIPRIAGVHRPRDVPFNYIKHLHAMMFEALDLYEVPPDKRASAIGFAVQKAIDVGKETLDPTIAADIVTECAVPAAKFDPARFR
jgi:hypothetical protein